MKTVQLTDKEMHLIVCLLEAEKDKMEYEGQEAYAISTKELIEKIQNSS